MTVKQWPKHLLTNEETARLRNLVKKCEEDTYPYGLTVGDIAEVLEVNPDRVSSIVAGNLLYYSARRGINVTYRMVNAEHPIWPTTQVVIELAMEVRRRA